MRAVHVRWVGFWFSIGSDSTNGTETVESVSSGTVLSVGLGSEVENTGRTPLRSFS